MSNIFWPARFSCQALLCSLFPRKLCHAPHCIHIALTSSCATADCHRLNSTDFHHTDTTANVTSAANEQSFGATETVKSTVRLSKTPTQSESPPPTCVCTSVRRMHNSCGSKGERRRGKSRTTQPSKPLMPQPADVRAGSRSLSPASTLAPRERHPSTSPRWTAPVTKMYDLLTRSNDERAVRRTFVS